MKLTVKFGLILAGVSIIWTLFEIFLANQLGLFSASTITSLLAFFIPVIILFIALQEQKKHQDFFHSLDGLKTGAPITIIGAFIFSLFLFVLYSLFPDIINPYLDYLKEQLAETDATPEEIAASIEMIKTQFSATGQAVYTFFSLTVVGTVLSWLYGRFMKTKIKHTEISTSPPNTF